MAHISNWNISAQQRPDVRTQETRPWAVLDHRTGWIFVADIYVQTGDWASNPKHDVIRRNTSGSRQDGVIPEVGDVLRIITPSELYIINYKNEGELNRLATMAGRVVMADDAVGFLPVGAEVEVREVSRGRVLQGIQGIWARVVPHGSRNWPK